MKLTMFCGMAAFSFLISKPAFSQYEITASTGLEIPMGNLKWTYGPSLSYNASFSSIKDTRKPLKWAYGVNLGYVNFDSGDKVLSYTTQYDELGEAQFGDFKTLMLFVNLGWKYEVNDFLEAFFGGDMGYYYSWYSFSIEDPGQSVDGRHLEGRMAFSPKAGLSVLIDDNWGFFVQSRYNFCLRTSDPSTGMVNSGGYGNATSGDEGYSGQGDFGTLIKIWSNNIGIQYRFG